MSITESLDIFVITLLSYIQHIFFEGVIILLYFILRNICTLKCYGNLTLRDTAEFLVIIFYPLSWCEDMTICVSNAFKYKTSDKLFCMEDKPVFVRIIGL